MTPRYKVAEGELQPHVETEQPDPAEPPAQPAEQPEHAPDPTDPSDPAAPVNPDVDEPAFDVEAFVRSLPEGVTLCPLCLGMGGVVADPPYDPRRHYCTTCRGFGRVRTGSLVGGQGEVKCDDCNGQGWVGAAADEPPATPAAPEHFTAAEPPVDVHGRTPDHPDFDWSRVVAPALTSEHDTAAEPAQV